MKKDAKTTILAIIKVIIIILGIFGINFNPEHTELLSTAILSVWAVIEVSQGYFSKDKESK